VLPILNRAVHLPESAGATVWWDATVSHYRFGIAFPTYLFLNNIEDPSTDMLYCFGKLVKQITSKPSGHGPWSVGHLGFL